MANDVPKLPLVLAIWKDANTGNDDVVTLENVTTYHKPTLVNTLGWLVHEDEEGLTIVNEFYDDAFRGRTFIYRPMLVKLIQFKLVKSRHKNNAKSDVPSGS